MSLDDIIASNRRGGRGGGRGRGGRGRGGRGRGGGGGGDRSSSNGGGPMRRGGRGGARSSPYSRPRSTSGKWEHDMYENRGGAGGRRTEGLTTGGSHLQIANLDFAVTESDIKELFTEFGALKKAIINYDSSGRSHGTADVVFERRADAQKAVKTYNGVPLDGRPMKIEIVAGQFESPRNGGGGGGGFRRRSSDGGRGGGSGRGGFRPRGGRSDNFSARGGSRGGGGRGRGRGRGRGGRRDQREPVSKDDLDKELDSYVSSK